VIPLHLTKGHCHVQGAVQAVICSQRKTESRWEKHWNGVNPWSISICVRIVSAPKMRWCLFRSWRYISIKEDQSVNLIVTCLARPLAISLLNSRVKPGRNRRRIVGSRLYPPSVQTLSLSSHKKSLHSKTVRVISSRLPHGNGP
jgi:hypothetical protein